MVMVMVCVDHFCNFSKPAIQHSHPLHIVIGQLRWGERGSRVCTSFSLLSFFHSLYSSFFHFECEQPSAMVSRNDRLVSPYLYDIPSPPSLWCPTFHSAFQCGYSKSALTLLPSDMIELVPTQHSPTLRGAQLLYFCPQVPPAGWCGHVHLSNVLSVSLCLLGPVQVLLWSGTGVLELWVTRSYWTHQRLKDCSSHVCIVLSVCGCVCVLLKRQERGTHTTIHAAPLTSSVLVLLVFSWSRWER